MSLAAITKSQITGPVRLREGLDTRKTEDRRSTRAAIDELDAMLDRCVPMVEKWSKEVAAVKALGKEAIQRWRELVLANEPRKVHLAQIDSSDWRWTCVLYDRAVLGVVMVFDDNGETVLIPVAEYWAMEKAKG